MAFISFGDSWPAGEELGVGEQTFPQILAEKLGQRFQNYSQPCTGIPHTLLQLKQCIEENLDQPLTVLFSLSSPSRSIYFDKTWQEIQARRSDIVSQTYYRYIQSDQLDSFMFSTYVLALQKICQTFNINDYYVSCWSPVQFYLPGIDKQKFYPKTMVDILGCGVRSHDCEIKINPNHPMIYPNKFHPNALGHKQIAHELFSWINNVQP